MRKLKEIIKKHFEEVLRTKSSPESIALGFSLGTFISILPTPGLNIIIGAAILLISERINKISLFGSMALWNPITLIPIYILSKQIGNIIFGAAPITSYELEFMDMVFDFTRRFLVGNLILAFSISFSSYFIVKKIASKEWHIIPKKNE